MKKNHELFWILEVLLLMPICLFWISIISMFLTGSSTLYYAILGQPVEILKAAFVLFVCPGAAAWIAYEYLRENKKEKGTSRTLARTIVGVSLATIGVVIIYLFKAAS